MSFDTLKVAELKQIADSFGVDLDEAGNKQEILAALAEEGVTYEMYEEFSNAEHEELEPEVKQAPKKNTKKSSANTVLVKMERHNFSYQTFGYEFTHEHPYVAMPEEDAQLIFDHETGFRMATPREVQEYYS